MQVILCMLVFTFCVYIRLYLMNILSLQLLCIKILQNFHRKNHLFHLKEQTELFLPPINPPVMALGV